MVAVDHMPCWLLRPDSHEGSVTWLCGADQGTCFGAKAYLPCSCLLVWVRASTAVGRLICDQHAWDGLFKSQDCVINMPEPFKLSVNKAAANHTVLLSPPKHRQVTSSQHALDALPDLVEALIEAPQDPTLPGFNADTHCGVMEEGQAVLRLPMRVC